MTTPHAYDGSLNDGFCAECGESARDPRHQDAAPRLDLGDCVSCDGYILDASEFPHCPSCARLTREGKPL